MRRGGFEGDEGMHEPGDVPRSGVRPGWIVAGVAAVLLLVLALQNSERVDVDFLLFDAQIRVIFVILGSAVVGFLVGWFIGRPSRAERKAMRKGMDD